MLVFIEFTKFYKIMKRKKNINGHEKDFRLIDTFVKLLNEANKENKRIRFIRKHKR